MKLKQIFSAYDFEKNGGISHLKYCSSCGTECTLKEDGGKERPVCPNCGFVHYKNPSPAVSVLVIDNDRVLLGKRAQGSFEEGKWCLPCGFIEFDEDFLTAAFRETKEETGLEIKIESIIDVTFNFLSKNLHTLVIVLLASVIGGKEEAGDDIASIEWYPLSGPLPEMAFSADKHIIEKYYKTKIKGLAIDADFDILSF